MLQSARVTKIRIIGPQTQLPLLIRTLYSLKLVHLLDHKKTEDLDIGTPLGNSEHISGLLVRVRSLLASFDPALVSLAHSTQTKKPALSLADVETDLTTLLAEYEMLHQQQQTLLSSLAETKATNQQLCVLAALHLNAASLAPFRSLHSFIGSVSSPQELENALLHVTKKLHVTLAQVDGVSYAAVFVDLRHGPAISSVLHTHGFKALSFGDLSSYQGSLDEHIKKLQISLHLLEKDAAHIATQLSVFQKQHVSSLLSFSSYLQQEYEQAQAPLRFAETARSFALEGWVSVKEFHQLKGALEHETKHKIYIETLEVAKTDKVPIILKNMFFVKPFEFFLHLYTLPNYKELDPSFFLFFTFPFFFGLMLGDVGYGLVTLLLFALLWWKMPSGRNLLTVMMLSAIISIFFGFVFGEYFGFEHVSEQTGEQLLTYGIPLHEEVLHNGELVYSFPRILNRLHGEMTILDSTLPTVLVLGAILGFIHVNLGLFLGFINELVSHGFAHAFYAKISWYILELGAAILALSSLGLVPLHWGIGFSLIILAAVLLFIGEGVQGLVEIPAILTNILSYLRLGAVGLSSVGLAVVVNENLALPFMEKGGLYFVLALFILVAGHSINIALGVIGPFLHSLRLHYVEFFSKFYKGGGIPFVAFGQEKDR